MCLRSLILRRRSQEATGQDVAAVRELVAGKDAKAAGIVYLQDEAYEFQAKEGGRSWSVYGSPVRCRCHTPYLHRLTLSRPDE